MAKDIDYSRLRWSIGFKPKHMKFFEDNKTDIQQFTRDAVSKEIERVKASADSNRQGDGK